MGSGRDLGVQVKSLVERMHMTGTCCAVKWLNEGFPVLLAAPVGGLNLGVGVGGE